MSRLDDAVAEAIDELEDEDDLAALTEIRESADDAPVIKLVNSLIAQAVEEGASDVHFEPMESRDMRVRYRIDGVLSETTADPEADERGRRLAHQDHGRPRHRRAPASAGRPRLAAGRGPRHRHPRRHDPRRLGRGHRHAPPRQGAGAPVDGHARDLRRLADPLRPGDPPVVRRDPRDRARPARASRRRSTRRSTRSTRRRRTSSRSRTRSSTSSRGSTRSRST